MIGKMQDVQRQGGNNPIVIHCRYILSPVLHKFQKNDNEIVLTLNLPNFTLSHRVNIYLTDNIYNNV